MNKKTLVLPLWAVISFVMIGSAVAQDQTLKLGDKVVERAEDLNSAIRSTNLQVKKTLESYNYIVEGKAEDPRTEYKKLTKQLDKSIRARDDVLVKATNLKEAAAKYFDSWDQSLAGFSDPEMKAKSETRLAASRENYDKIVQVGSSAGEEFETFITKMNDQIRFLGQDLSPAAIKELSGKASELNGQADTLFKSISDTLTTSSDYVDAMKPR